MHHVSKAAHGLKVNGSTVRPRGEFKPKPKAGQPFGPSGRFPFYQAPHGLVADPWLSNGAKILWMLLADHAGERQTAWPSRGRLGKLMGRSVRQVERYAAELAAAGLVEISVRKPQSNLWTLVYRARLEGNYLGVPSRGVRLPVGQERDVNGPFNRT